MKNIMLNRMQSVPSGKSNLDGKLLIIALVCLISASAFSQNITNTLGTSGLFIIKDASNNYLTLDQSTGQMNIRRTLRLENTTNPNLGVIFKGTDRFIHNYSPDGADGYNTFIGINSGNFTMTGGYNLALGEESLFSNTDGWGNTALGFQSLSSNTTGFQNTSVGLGSLQNSTTANNNTAVGYLSLNSNTIGSENTALGQASLQFNTTGIQNTALGSGSLNYNITGNQNTALGVNSLNKNTIGLRNTAVGYASLNTNTTGQENTAVGLSSLQNNITGIKNTAMGVQSLLLNTTGKENTAIGYQSLSSNTTGTNNSASGYKSLYSNTTGCYNLAFGDASLYNNTTGYFNVAVGVNAGSNITTGSNNIAIGNGAMLSDGTSDNQVRIGHNFITYASINVAWAISSDRRWKENIKPTNLGLNFISELNPVSYTRKNDEKHKTEYGVIAQELEGVLKECGVENAGMLSIDNRGGYELRYNDLLAPMIKAIQELKKKKDVEIAELKTANEELKKTTIGLLAANDRLKAKLDDINEIKEQLSEIKTLKEELTERIKLMKANNKTEDVKLSSLGKQ
jgi:trimeric autotransporter adhesin